MKLSIIIILLVSSFVIQAQDKFKIGVLSESDKKFSVYEKDTTASAVYLYECGDNYFEIRDNYIWLITKYHAKIKILKKDGFEHANVEIPLYNSNSNKEKLVTIRAITHNGQIKKGVRSEEFFEEEINDRWSQIKFTFPDVQEGSIIEYAYETQSPFYYNFSGWNFQADIPKIYSEFNAKIPGNWVYNRSLIGSLKLDVNEADLKKYCFTIPGGTNEASCEVLKYVMKDIPAFDSSEAFMLSSRNYRSKLEFELSEYKRFDGTTNKYTKTWEDVDKEFKSDRDIGSQLRKKFFFEKQVADELLHSGDELTRAKNIFDFVKKHYTWNEENGIWNDNRVKTAFEEKKGNAAEINITLINLLNAAEITTNMMLVATRNKGLPKKTHPVMNDFNYILAKVDIGGKSYLLDATEKNLPFGILPFRCLNYYGRVMDFDNESYWYDILPETSNVKMIRAQMTLDPINKKLSGVFDLINIGYMKVSQDEVLETTKEEEYLDKLEQEISDDFHIVSHEKKLKYSDDKKLTERFNFEIENLFQGDDIYLNPFVIKFFDKNPFVSTERNYPIDFGYPMKYQYILNMKIPVGYKLKSLPDGKNYNLPNNGGLLKLNVIDNESGSLNLFFTFELTSAHYSNDYYSGIKQLFSEAVNGQNQSLIVLEKI